MHSTPASLLERLRRPGDTAAWDRFVRLYSPIMYEWLRRKGMQHHDASDLIQDVWIRLLRQMLVFQYDPNRSFHRWLYTVTMNAWRDRARMSPRFAAGLNVDLAESDDTARVVDQEFRTQVVRRVFSIIESDFTAQSAGIFRDLVWNEQPAEEVAERYSVNVGTVYAVKCRILARIRAELQGLTNP